ncbi:MAG: hypothetical protein ACI9W4_001742 [Rhodothermales bacterium]|jgi:hypothetical protein
MTEPSTYRFSDFSRLDRKTLTGPDSHFLGCEKRIEDAFLQVLRHPATGIRKPDLGELPINRTRYPDPAKIHSIGWLADGTSTARNQSQRRLECNLREARS